MTMDLETLITAVTECVMVRIKAEKRGAKKQPLPIEVDIFFDNLTQGVPIIVPHRGPLTIKIVSMRLIKALCKLATGQELKTATVTAKLKARDCYPIDPGGRDSRRRLYIDGKQEICYVFVDKASTHVVDVIAAIMELSAKYPELSNG